MKTSSTLIFFKTIETSKGYVYNLFSGNEESLKAFYNSDNASDIRIAWPTFEEWKGQLDLLGDIEYPGDYNTFKRGRIESPSLEEIKKELGFLSIKTASKIPIEFPLFWEKYGY